MCSHSCCLYTSSLSGAIYSTLPKTSYLQLAESICARVGRLKNATFLSTTLKHELSTTFSLGLYVCKRASSSLLAGRDNGVTDDRYLSSDLDATSTTSEMGAPKVELGFRYPKFRWTLRGQEDVKTVAIKR